MSLNIYRIGLLLWSSLLFWNLHSAICKDTSMEEVYQFGVNTDDLIEKYQREDPEGAKEYHEVMSELMKEYEEAEKLRLQKAKKASEERYRQNKEQPVREKPNKYYESSEEIKKEAEKLKRREKISMKQWERKGNTSQQTYCLPYPMQFVCGFNILFGAIWITAISYFVYVCFHPKNTPKAKLE